MLDRHNSRYTYLGSIVSRDFAKGFVAVDDRVIDNLSVCQEETAIRCSNSIHKQNKNQTFIQIVTRKNGNGFKNEQ